MNEPATSSPSELALRKSFGQALQRMFPSLSRDCSMSLLKSKRTFSELLSFFLQLRDKCLQDLEKLIEFHSYELNDIELALSDGEFDIEMISHWVFDPRDLLWSEYVRERGGRPMLDDRATGIAWMDNLIADLKKHAEDCELLEVTELDQCMERYRQEIRDIHAPGPEQSALVRDLLTTMSICKSNLSKKIQFALRLWKQVQSGEDVLTLYELRQEDVDVNSYVQNEYRKRLKLQDPMAHAFNNDGGTPQPQRGATRSRGGKPVLIDGALTLTRMLDSLHLFPSPLGFCFQVFVLEIDEQDYKSRTSIRSQDCLFVDPFCVEQSVRKYKVSGEKIIGVFIRNIHPSGQEIQIYCNDDEQDCRVRCPAETYFSKLGEGDALDCWRATDKDKRVLLTVELHLKEGT